MHCSQHPAQPASGSICSENFPAAAVTGLTSERTEFPFPDTGRGKGLSHKSSHVTDCPELPVDASGFTFFLSVSESLTCFLQQLLKRSSALFSLVSFMKRLYTLAPLVFTAHLRMWSRESFVTQFYGCGNSAFRMVCLTASHGTTKCSNSSQTFLTLKTLSFGQGPSSFPFLKASWV